MTFAKAIGAKPKIVKTPSNNAARTTNNMKAQATSGSPTVDFFYAIGASRGKDLSVPFAASYNENRQWALRTLFWGRDVRGGAGEREVFRKILRYIENNHPNELAAVVANIPTYGRWDDVFALTTDHGRQCAFGLIAAGLAAKDGLCAKWMPRKGQVAVQLREYLGMSPKQYRKTLVGLSNTVEQKMCAKDWSEINYSHVPSVAAARYQKAFSKHDPVGYSAYREALKKPEKIKSGEVKINAAAVYPYDVIKSYYNGDKEIAAAQWEALPNYVGNASVLPIVDTSGSMSAGISGHPTLQAYDIAASLGVYLADKNKGPFKDVWMNFSTRPKLKKLGATFAEKVKAVFDYNGNDWDGSTNLHAAIELILETAVKAKLPAADMPQILLILSDMQFNHCAQYDDRAIDMIARKYEAAGYSIPRVVFWNLRDVPGNKPVTVDERGVAMVSGFSPAIMKTVLSADLEQFTPLGMVLKTINDPRYAQIV